MDLVLQSDAGILAVAAAGILTTALAILADYTSPRRPSDRTKKIDAAGGPQR